MSKKRLAVAVLTGIMMMLSFLLPGCGKKGGEKVLNVYNWSNYIDESVVKDFEEEFGVRVNYDTYGSNEELLAKLQTGVGGYDLIVPSEYMVEIMIQQGLLAELNHDNIPNLKNLDETFLDLPFDPGNRYSVPYTWGTVGIGVNTRYVTEEVDSWEVLWNPAYKGRIVMLNDIRETFGITLKMLGYSLNSTNPEEIEEARNKLLEQKPLVKAYDSENVKHFMVSGEAWLVHAWPGDVLMAAEENPDLVYVLPKEGSSIWADSFAIPAKAPNKELAEQFINFMLRPDISARITETLYYGNPNRAAWPFISEKILSEPAVFPSEEALKNSEWMHDLGDVTPIYDRYWTEIKGD